MSNELLPNPDQYPDWKSWAGVLIAKMRLAKLDAEDLQNNLISAAHIVAGSIETAKIAAGAITADKIAAGAITTSKLLVSNGGAALNSDPGTTDISAWFDYTGGALAAKYTIVDKGSGGKVGALALNGAGLAGSTAEAANFPQIPVDPNKTYRIHAWFNSDASANGTVYLEVIYYTQAGVYTSGYISLSAWGPNVGWAEHYTTFGYGTANPIPAGAYFMAPDVALNYGGTAGNTWAQDIRIEEVVPSTLIQDGSITTAKIVALAITTAKIAAGAVTATEIAANTITAAKIAGGTITATEIASDAITTAKINAGAITTAKISAGAVTVSELGANAVTTAKINTGAVTASELGTGAVTNTKLGAGAVTAAKIASATITAAEIAANTITAAEIAADAITTSELAANAVTAGNIDAGAVNAGNIIVDNIIVTGHLVDNSVTAAVTVSDPTGLTVFTTQTTEIVTGTFTATNSAVLVGIAFDVSAGVSYTWSLLRDASVVFTTPSGTAPAVRTALTCATGGAGSHTWSIKVHNISGALDTNITNIEFAVKDWKK